jgi:hypothetical protein
VTSEKSVAAATRANSGESPPRKTEDQYKRRRNAGQVKRGKIPRTLPLNRAFLKRSRLMAS